MIVVTRSFAGILDDWLASLGLSGPVRTPRRGSASAVLPLKQWTADVHAAIALAPGPARGLDIARHVQLRHVGPLGYMAVNTQTLGEFLDVYRLLEKWFYGSNWAQLSDDDAQTEIAWDRRYGVPDRVIEQLHVLALVNMARMACPGMPPLLRVDVMNAAQGEAQHYRSAFGCPVRFGQPALRLVFAAEAMQAPVDITHAALSPAWRKRQRTLREALPGATQFVRAVQSAILNTLPGGAPADAVAERLNLSRRTLQRRLTDSACSYRQLLEGVRERHARQLLADPALSLKEIVFLLGYAEQSTFNHACQRWNLGSPGKRLR